MKTIKIKFVGKDWDRLPPGEVPHPFKDVLKNNYKLEFSETPDYVISKESRNFYSKCVLEHAATPIRVLFAGEAFVPDFNIFDYAIGFDRIKFGDRYFRFGTTNYFSFDRFINLLKDRDEVDSLLNTERKFCNYIYSNSASNSMRTTLFKRVSEYRHVDSAGALLRNMDYRIETGKNWCKSKISFQKNYKFSLAIENSEYRGYTTEKLLHPMSANSLPIYWGNADVGKEFNTRSFINCHDYNSIDEIIDAIKKIDQDDTLYKNMLTEPWRTAVQEEESRQNNEEYSRFIRNIFDQDIERARRRGNGTWVWRYEDTLTKRIQLHEKYLGSFRHRFLRRMQKWGIYKR